MPFKILVPLDGSRLSELALPYAEALARPARGRMILIRAAESARFPVLEPAYAEAERILDADKYLHDVAYKLTERGSSSGHQVVADAAPRDGDVAGWILGQAHAQGADLIVMATNGRTGLNRLVYGSVTKQVLDRTPLPVLLVRAWEEQPPAPFVEHPTLVVPLDGSPSAEQALQIAKELADVLAGRLLLVRAVPRSVQARGRALLYAQAQHSLLKVEAQEYLERLASELRTQRVVVEPYVHDGEPAEAITAAARDHSAALVVMTTGDCPGMSRVRLGSVPHQVLRNGTVPLLLIPPLDSPGADPSYGP